MTRILLSAIVVGLSFSFGIAQEKLTAQISKEQASKAALEQVKGGVVKEAELEKEKGKLIWSFDIQVGKEMKEVWVDANSGAVIKTETESTRAEAAEKATDRAEKIALKAVPGEVMKSEIKTTNGKTIYSIEIKKSDGTITEVDVDGKTHKIVSTEKEEPKTK